MRQSTKNLGKETVVVSRVRSAFGVSREKFGSYCFTGESNVDQKDLVPFSLSRSSFKGNKDVRKGTDGQRKHSISGSMHIAWHASRYRCLAWFVKGQAGK